MQSGIIPLTRTELDAAGNALGQDWIASGLANEPQKRRQLVVDVFAAFYRKRYGMAPGTTAVNTTTGQSAIRFWDNIRKEFRWALHPDPEAVGHGIPQTINHVEKLPGEEAPMTNRWTYHERPWSELVTNVTFLRTGV